MEISLVNISPVVPSVAPIAVVNVTTVPEPVTLWYPQPVVAVAGVLPVLTDESAGTYGLLKLAVK